MNELYHHGIKGQKWGIRRFQNKDGSLTAAGRKRYGSEEALNKHIESEMKKDFSTVKTQFDKTKAQMGELRSNPSKRLKQDVKKGQKELINLMKQLKKKYDVADVHTGFEGEMKKRRNVRKRKRLRRFVFGDRREIFL